MARPSTDPDFDQHLACSPVLMILRGVARQDAVDTAEALIDAGIRLLEVTMNTDSAVEILECLVDRYGDRDDVMIGAGTVVDAADVDVLAGVGVRFIVSPNVDGRVIERTRELELVSIPGFFSPSEAIAAARYGGQYLKCFPAHVLGAGYIKDLKAVLAPPVLAVGGVTPENAKDYLSVCAGLGVGSAVWRPGMAPDEARSRAARLLACCRVE